VQLVAVSKAANPGVLSGPGTGWNNVKMNGTPLDFDLKKLNWPRKLPRQGVLQLDYAVVRGAAREPKVLDEEDLQNMIHELSNPRLSDFHRLDLLRVFAAHHTYQARQTTRLLEQFSAGDERVMACVHLFARLVDAENVHSVLKRLTQKELVRFNEQLGTCNTFNSNNPTGHYELNLALLADRLIAMRIAELAQNEGDVKNWFNVRHGQKAYNALYGAPPEWQQGGMPTSGVLSLDYLSHIGPPEGAKPLTDDKLDGLISNLMQMEASAEDKVGWLRLRSTSKYLTCSQLVKIVDVFLFSAERVEVAVMFYNRLVDKDDFWEVVYCLTNAEQAQVTLRLGPKQLFNPKHPSMHFYLDTKIEEHMDVAKKLVPMAQLDDKRQNMMNNVVNGRRLGALPEGDSLWNLLTTATFTPVLDFDFVGDDSRYSTEQGLLPGCNPGKIMLFERQRQMHLYFKEILPARPKTISRMKAEKSSKGKSFKRGNTPGTPDDKPVSPERTGRRGGVGDLSAPKDSVPSRETAPEVRDRAAEYKLPDAAMTLKELYAASPSGRTFHWQIGFDRHMRATAAAEVDKEELTALPLDVHFFQHLDTSQRGAVTFDELTLCWERVFGFRITQAKLGALFEAFVQDKLAGLTYEDFERMCMLVDWRRLVSEALEREREALERRPKTPKTPGTPGGE